jgi:diadenosine tetraphosphate (Ap4A) HIT family hydrolase
MKYIYAPNRNMSKNYQKFTNKPTINNCTFCNIFKDIKNQKHIIYKDKYCFVVMNKYPYSCGHILLIPNKHITSITSLEPKVWQHISNIMQKTTSLLCESLNTKHINIGINIDEYAGASIAKHLHIHFVPRYKGDTNFMTAIFDTRVYPNNFDDIYQSIIKNVSKFL